MKAWESLDEASVGEAARGFFLPLLGDPRYTHIATMERMGTAVLRAFLKPTDPIWEKVFALDVIGDSLEREENAHVLVVEDSARTGSHLLGAGEKLGLLGKNTRVTVAAFLVHYVVPWELVDIAYLRGLDDKSYNLCRRALILHLQERGSLLLDTEHLEVIAEADVSANEFAASMAGWGKTVKYASGRERTNYTVIPDRPELIESLESLVPSEGNLKAGPIKIRAIHQGRRSKTTFSLIPIVYPQLRLTSQAVYEHPRMDWVNGIGGVSRVFHCVGLCLSIELLLDAMAWLKADLGGKIRFTYGEQTFGHLSVVFPEVEIEQITRELNRVWQAPVARRTQRRELDDPGTEVLAELAREILRSCFDRKKFEAGFIRCLTYAEVLEIGRMCGHTHERASAALDLLIDQAQIIPGVECDQNGGDIETATRVFGPEGELMSRAVIREALLAGRGLEINGSSERGTP